MDPGKLYSADVLRDKVPTLHPRYQWMAIELEPDDRVVLTTINGHAPVSTIIELCGLPEESVARVILKLVGRGLVLFDDELPFYDEGEILQLLPTFDPTNTNRSAHLDDTDRMLLTLINGRTSVGQMESALPLTRHRLIASVIRLRLADVIGFAEPEVRKPVVLRRPAAAASAPVPPGVEPVTPSDEPPRRPLPRSATGAVGSGHGAPSFSEPRSGAVDRQRPATRQEAFEEVARQILTGERDQVPGFESEGGPAPKVERSPRSPKPDKKTKKIQKPSEAKTRPARQPAPSRPAEGIRVRVDLRLAVKAAAFALILLGAYAGFRYVGSLEAPPAYVGREHFAPVDVVEVFQAANAAEVTAVMGPSWAASSADGKKEAVKSMIHVCRDRRVTRLLLQDGDGNRLAEWDGDTITFY